MQYRTLHVCKTAAERLSILLVHLDVCIRKEWYWKNFWSRQTQKTPPLLLDNTDTYIHKAIILKNNKALPQTDMKTTVISYPVYRKELWCWFTLYSCLFLQILAFLGVPQLPQALHETMRDSPLSIYRSPHSSPFSMTALLSLNSFKLP